MTRLVVNDDGLIAVGISLDGPLAALNRSDEIANRHRHFGVFGTAAKTNVDDAAADLNPGGLAKKRHEFRKISHVHSSLKHTERFGIGGALQGNVKRLNDLTISLSDQRLGGAV